jgi:hypothetical protein
VHVSMENSVAMIDALNMVREPDRCRSEPDD